MQRRFASARATGSSGPTDEDDRPTLAPPAPDEPPSKVFRRVANDTDEDVRRRDERATLPDGELDDVAKHFRAGDFEGALAAAERLRRDDPASERAAALARSSRLRLRAQLAAELGSALSVPRVAVPLERIPSLGLDHRAGFLLSRVDGHTTIEELLDTAGMDEIDALRILVELKERRIIAVR